GVTTDAEEVIPKIVRLFPRPACKTASMVQQKPSPALGKRKIAPVKDPQAGKTLSALRRRAEVRRAAEVARRQDVRVWIVGGALRDRALGRPVPEVDLAVSGDAERLARALERAGAGRAVFLSRG